MLGSAQPLDHLMLIGAVPEVNLCAKQTTLSTPPRGERASLCSGASGEDREQLHPKLFIKTCGNYS